MSKVRQAAKSWRLWLICCIFSAVLAGVVSRLVWLHVIETRSLQDIGDEITIRIQPIPSYRGMITDRSGRPLAISTPVAAVGIRPDRLLDDKWSNALAPLLKTDAEVLRERVDKTRLPFIYLSRYVTPETANLIESLSLDGLEVSRQFRRFYPSGEVTSHIVGFTDIEDRGQEGLELIFDTWLSGRDGRRHILKNRRANVFRYVSAGKEVDQGKDLKLSIDLRLQYLTYRALKEAVTQARAVGGSAVLIDAWSGEILACAGQPSFNPNDMTSRTPERIRNRPITDLMEPGSPIKPFTVATALDLGVVEPTTEIDTSPGKLMIQDHVISDLKNYGIISVSEVISKSSNVGTSKIALMLEPHILRDRLAILGLGSQTPLGLPGEAEGYLPPASIFKQMDQAALSYGYTLSVTTMQLAQAYSVFANKGYVQPLTILADGMTSAPRKVFKKETIRQILPILQSVTENGGTAKTAQIPMYHVGGKTGTTMKYSAGSYASQKYVSTFVGLAPISNPRFVMAITIDDPQSQQYFGGQIAAPVFADVMDDVMRIYDIPPDKIDSKMLIREFK